MDIVLLTIGKTNTNYIQTGIDEYLKRLKRYVNFSIHQIPDIRKGGLSEQMQKVKEGETILSFLNNSDRLVLLDERGTEYTSEDYAEWLQKRMASGLKRLVFCIGGPYGFSEDVYARANEMISLSKMTFNHEMVRLFFTEQLYRGFTILRGEPYHHS
jgi:23S rRNA (pseudouridine1915-N3)-methyltransferase